MATSAAQTLRYVLPTAAVRLTAQVRLAVEPDSAGGHLTAQVAVRLGTRTRTAPVMSIQDVRLPDKLPPWARRGELRRRFDREAPRISALIADLAARSEQFLAGLRMGEDVADVITFGKALEVVHRELAGADLMRREWIARQGRILRTSTWDLDEADLLPLEAAVPTLPGDLALPEGDAVEIAADYGLLLAVVANDAQGATLVAYRRAPRSLPDVPDAETPSPWTCDAALSHLRLSDSPDIPRPRGAGDDPFSAPLHEGCHTPFQDSPLDHARRQLALLEASDEYSHLASTHERTSELTALELLSRLTATNGC